ncbi:thiamine pyrophosphate-binding protein [Streptomyces sp. NBC_01335]|uniref:thiamine pyrophosphate-binding protein n=1 Tax=Streptomyces sp. NBC_01335 TaxID=2903828 RepID=UPI002E0FA650|nr:thiamine pyrophosphate-binding protein [Streptomyces sp. NBC_01335]
MSDTTAATAVFDALVEHDMGPYFATPCGVLAPLLAQLQERADYHVVAREDNAVGMAAGVALTGGTATVLMQNSGFGQSVNALASLVVPYRIPMLLIISMRGTPPDPTPENLAMGRLTAPILDGLGIGHHYLSAGMADDQIRDVRRTVVEKRHSHALLVRPDEFDWEA